MKANLAAKAFSLAILFLAVALFSGCQTAPPVDWNSRVGHYTYSQALAEFGSPAKQTKLSDGNTVDQWITLHGSTGPVGGADAGAIDTMGGGQPVVQTYKDHVLELTFGADGKLAAWAKNY